jgi:hypothetical protein
VALARTRGPATSAIAAPQTDAVANHARPAAPGVALRGRLPKADTSRRALPVLAPVGAQPVGAQAVGAQPVGAQAVGAQAVGAQVAAVSAAPLGRLRRCTFRRLEPSDTESRRSMPATYAVSCLYPAPEGPLALGDVAAAMPVCAACTATGIFRPDEA